YPSFGFFYTHPLWTLLKGIVYCTIRCVYRNYFYRTYYRFMIFTYAAVQTFGKNRFYKKRINNFSFTQRSSYMLRNYYIHGNEKLATKSNEWIFFLIGIAN